MRIFNVTCLAAIVLTVAGALVPDQALAQALEVYAYGNGHILERIFTAVAAFSNTSANSLLKFTALASILFFIWNIMMGEGRPQAHFIHFLVIAILYLGMFVPKVTVTILDQSRAPGALLPFTATVQNVPAGLGYLASMTSRLGKRTTELMETAFSEPGYLQYARYGLAIGPHLITTNPNFPTREMANTHRYLMDCFYPMLQNGWGGKTPNDLVNSGNLLLYIAPSAEVMNLSLQYQDPGGTLLTLTCNEAYVNIRNDMQAWLSNQGPQDMAARLQLADKAELLSILGPAYFAYTGMNLSSQDVIQQRVMFQAFRQAMTSGSPGSSELMSTFALEANKYAVEQTTVQITAQMFKAYLPIFRTVYQAILFGLFPIVLAMAFLSATHGRIIGTYFRHMIWIELWDPVFAIHNYVSFLYQSSALKNQFATASFTLFSLESSTQLDQTASFDYAVVLLTAPVAVSFAYFIASATESIGEGLLSGVSSKISAASGVGGGEGLVARGVYTGPAGSLTDQRLTSANAYTMNERGELEMQRGAEGSPGMRTPVNTSSVGKDSHIGPSNEIVETYSGNGKNVKDIIIPDSNNVARLSMAGDGLQATQNLSNNTTSGERGGVTVTGQAGSSTQEQRSLSNTTSISDSASSNVGHQHLSATGTNQAFNFSENASASVKEGEAARSSWSTALQQGLADSFGSTSEMRAGLAPGFRSGGSAAGKINPKSGQPSQPNPAGSAPTAPGAPGVGQPGSATAALSGSPTAAAAGSNQSWLQRAMMEAVPVVAATAAGLAAGSLTGGVGAVPAAVAARAVTAKGVQMAASQLMPRIMAAAKSVAGTPEARAAFAKKAVAAVAAGAAMIGPKLNAGTGVSHSNTQNLALSDAEMKSLDQAIARDDSIATTLSRGLSISANEGQSSTLSFNAGHNVGSEQTVARGSSLTQTTSQHISGSAGQDFSKSASEGTSIAISQDLGRRIFGEMAARGHGAQAPAALRKVQQLMQSGDLGGLADYLSTLPSPTAQQTAQHLHDTHAQAGRNADMAARVPKSQDSPLSPSDKRRDAPSHSQASRDDGADRHDPRHNTTDTISIAEASMMAQAAQLGQQSHAVTDKADRLSHDYAAHAQEAPKSMEALAQEAQLPKQFNAQREAIRQTFEASRDKTDRERKDLWESGKENISPTLARDVIDKFAPWMNPPAHTVTPSAKPNVALESDSAKALRQSIESGPPRSPASPSSRKDHDVSSASSGHRGVASSGSSGVTPGGSTGMDAARQALAAMDHRAHGHPGRPHPGTDFMPSPPADGAARHDASGDSPSETTEARRQPGQKAAATPAHPNEPPSGPTPVALGAPVHGTSGDGVGGSRFGNGTSRSFARAAAATLN